MSLRRPRSGAAREAARRRVRSLRFAEREKILALLGGIGAPGTIPSPLFLAHKRPLLAKLDPGAGGKKAPAGDAGATSPSAAPAAQAPGAGESAKLQILQKLNGNK